MYAGMVGALVMTVAMPFWWTPRWMATLAPLTWFVFAATGVLGAMGHLLLIRAYSLAPASVIAPWTYMQLLLSIAIGLLVFDAVPDSITLIGMAIIGLSPQLTRLNRK